MAAKAKRKTTNESEQLVEFVAEIDRFGLLLESQEAETRQRTEAAAVAKAALDEAKRELTEAKEVQLATVSMLLRLIRPGQPRTYPLFDRMEEADEETHGHGSDQWRKEPIAALKLSGAAMRALVDADVLLVGQLQDLVLADRDWHEPIEGIGDGMADAIESKLNDFISDRSRR